MTVSNESGGWASIPPAYFAEPDGTDITNRLGRKTSSTDIGEGHSKNVRQRVLLVGQVAVEIMDPEILEFGIE
jgi:protein involved in temperature-dependent protein secretion